MLRLIQIFVIGLFLFSLNLFSQKADPQHKVKIGDEAPNFTLKFLDGTTKQLRDLRGKVIMLQFTASWCSVCLKEMPFIEEEIWKVHKDNPNFKLYGIDFKEDRETIEKFIQKTKVTYPILLDEDGEIFELYAEKGAGVTRNVIIDKQGKVRFLTRLFVREEFNEMKKKIIELLNE
ncbi:MAG TPA: TlpA disulfide reductase family protein [Candidatus Kapabacteria bacterium]|mgnify:CR=1 FL=1|jgi:peroxiredoxin|nr:TlpA disulfide reductase family protein [Candidatus Kapabacteria bacterium]HPU23356.1 TlpA disulfide reductase family protein [Candidatus Kapabacteria bacterium]